MNKLSCKLYATPYDHIFDLNFLNYSLCHGTMNQALRNQFYVLFAPYLQNDRKKIISIINWIDNNKLNKKYWSWKESIWPYYGTPYAIDVLKEIDSLGNTKCGYNHEILNKIHNFNYIVLTPRTVESILHAHQLDPKLITFNWKDINDPFYKIEYGKCRSQLIYTSISNPLLVHPIYEQVVDKITNAFMPLYENSPKKMEIWRQNNINNFYAFLRLIAFPDIQSYPDLTHGINFTTSYEDYIKLKDTHIGSFQRIAMKMRTYNQGAFIFGDRGSLLLNAFEEIYNNCEKFPIGEYDYSVYKDWEKQFVFQSHDKYSDDYVKSSNFRKPTGMDKGERYHSKYFRR